MIMYMSPMPAIIKCQRICFYVYSSAVMIGMLKVTFQSKRSEKCILYTKNDLPCPDIEFYKTCFIIQMRHYEKMPLLVESN